MQAIPDKYIPSEYTARNVVTLSLDRFSPKEADQKLAEISVPYLTQMPGGFVNSVCACFGSPNWVALKVIVEDRRNGQQRQQTIFVRVASLAAQSFGTEKQMLAASIHGTLEHWVSAAHPYNGMKQTFGAELSSAERRVICYEIQKNGQQWMEESRKANKTVIKNLSVSYIFVDATSGIYVSLWNDLGRARGKVGEGGSKKVYKIFSYTDVAARSLAVYQKKSMQHEIDLLRKFKGEAGIVKFHTTINFDHLNKERFAFIGDLYQYSLRDYFKDSATGTAVSSSVLDYEQLYDQFVDCLTGLHNLHLAGVIHNDIKPDNIFVDFDNNAFIGDLGSAVKKGEGPRGGTFYYFPPEYWESQHERYMPMVKPKEATEKMAKSFEEQYFELGLAADSWALGITYLQFLRHERVGWFPLIKEFSKLYRVVRDKIELTAFNQSGERVDTCQFLEANLKQHREAFEGLHSYVKQIKSTIDFQLPSVREDLKAMGKQQPLAKIVYLLLDPDPTKRISITNALTMANAKALSD